jgi:hypothetical protein
MKYSQHAKSIDEFKTVKKCYSKTIEINILTQEKKVKLEKLSASTKQETLDQLYHDCSNVYDGDNDMDDIRTGDDAFKDVSWIR